MTTSPTWFGSTDRPLFGVVHLPDGGRARAGVLLCPPMGKEHVDTYRGMKFLAQELTAAGFAVLRFDYAGVGDSSGEQDASDALAGWTASIAEGVAALREMGCRTVSAIGLRVGALLLDHAAADLGPLHTVVLWDPTPRGRGYVREQQALYRLGVGSDTDPAPSDGAELHTLGQTLSREAAAELSALNLTLSAPTVGTWIAALREGGAAARLSATLEAADARTIDVGPMADFVSPASFLVPVPADAVRTIVGAVDDAHDGLAADPVSFTPRRSATIRTGGGHVTETIDALGEHGLFAIRTTPTTPEDGPAGRDADATVVFCATANDTRIGPARLWVESARRAALSGRSALRYDRRGAGETGPVTAREHTPIYSPEGADDVVTAAREAHPDSRRVVLSGICSGSWNAAYAASRTGAASVVLVNAIGYSWRQKKSAVGAVDPATMGVPRTDPEWQKTPRARIKAALQKHLPYGAWLLLGRRGITQVPEVLLSTLAERGVQTTVVLAPADHRWFVDQRGTEGLRRIARTGRAPSVVEVGVGDHSGFHHTFRAAVTDAVLGALSVTEDHRDGALSA